MRYQSAHHLGPACDIRINYIQLAAARSPPIAYVTRPTSNSVKAVSVTVKKQIDGGSLSICRRKVPADSDSNGSGTAALVDADLNETSASPIKTAAAATAATAAS